MSMHDRSRTILPRLLSMSLWICTNSGRDFTIVMVTHDSFVADWAERIVKMEEVLIVSDKPSRGGRCWLHYE